MSPDPAKIGRLQPTAMKLLRPLAHRMWDITVEGLEHLPESGPAIFCPNHASVIDSLMLPVVLPRPLTYVGKAEYLDDWKTARLFPALGMIPIDRRGGDHARSALDAARAVLESGGWFGIYPEGTRSRSGFLHKGHTGAARLAAETGAPIHPVGLIGTREVQPPDQRLPSPFRPVTVRIGAPISAAASRGSVVGEAGPIDRAHYRRVTDEVMFEIQAMTGLRYVNTYAGAHADGGPTSSEPRPEGPSTPPAEPTIPRRSSASVLTPRPLEPQLASS